MGEWPHFIQSAELYPVETSIPFLGSDKNLIGQAKGWGKETPTANIGQLETP